MSNAITATSQYAIGDPPFLTEGATITMLESGFTTQILKEEDLAANACGATITVPAGTRWLVLTWRGDVDLKFDDDPQTPTLDCVLPLHGDLCPPQVNQQIVLPLNDASPNALQHVQVCAEAGCGAHYSITLLAA